MATRVRRKGVGGKTRRRSPSRRKPVLEKQPEPAESVEAAGLRYVSDMMPGIRRKRSGSGFSYVGTDGKIIKDSATLERIRSLAVPPRLHRRLDLSFPNGHIQATGRDARRRKQYRYHPRWREVRDETKFGRVLAFSDVLPRIRRQVQRDLSKQGLPREKVLATVVRLLDCTGIRIGNDEYARSNRSFGLTTLRDRHVEISGSNIPFEFRGKSGRAYNVSLNDRRLARIVQRCQALPGEDLFQYIDSNGVRQTVGSGDVNDYLRAISGQEFTAKDFRTWSGTKLAVAALTEIGAWTSQRQAKSNSCAQSIEWRNSSTTPGRCVASTTCTPRSSMLILPERCSKPSRMERGRRQRRSWTPTKLPWQASFATSCASVSPLRSTAGPTVSKPRTFGVSPTSFCRAFTACSGSHGPLALVPLERRSIPPGMSLMPQSFVRRDFSLNVGRLGSHWIHWGTMSTSPPARVGGLRRDTPSSPLGARPGKIWAVALGGWTLFGLSSFAACLVADVASGDASMPWFRLLAYSLGAAWVWAALTPPVLWLTRDARPVILGVAGAGVVLLSITAQTTLAVATGIATSGSSLLLPRVENGLLAYGALVVLGQASRYLALYKTRLVHASELEARLAKTHLQLLRMQLQPHFLFNTLNTIAGAIRGVAVRPRR